MNILRVDGSMRKTGSISRRLTDDLVARLMAKTPGATVATRDLANGVPLVNEAWINANFTAEADRTAAQRAILAASDDMVEELKAADAVVIGLPIYNFGPPAAVKAWVDMIARARLTFRYSSEGPVGLLTGKTAYLVVASGGSPAGSDLDFATGYLKHALAFVGITDVHVIDASAHMKGEAEVIARAQAQMLEAA